MALVSRWKRLVEMGCSGLEESEKHSVVLCNSIGAAMVLVSISYILVFHFAEMPLLTLGSVVLIPLYGLTLLLNYKKQYLAAKLWIKFILDLAIFLFSWAAGPETGIHYGFFLTVTFPFLLIRNSRLAALSSLTSAIGFIVFDIWQPMPIYSNSLMYGAIYLPVVSTVFFLVGFVLYTLSSNNLRHQRQLRDAAELKQSLLNMLSHDINNSLAAAIGGLRILNTHYKQELDDRGQRFLSRAQGALSELDAIIENVRQLQALEQGKFQPHRSPCKVDDIFKSLEDTFEETAAKKEIQLIFENKLPPNTTLFLDKVVTTHSILGNLISNALKFSVLKSIVIVRCEAVGESVLISVHDQGIGIPTSIRKKLFNSNAQTSRRGTSGEKGTGFGMPLVKLLTEELKGSIEVESWTKEEGSEQEPGTVITVRFPNWIVGYDGDPATGQNQIEEY